MSPAHAEGASTQYSVSQCRSSQGTWVVPTSAWASRSLYVGSSRPCEISLPTVNLALSMWSCSDPLTSAVLHTATSSTCGLLQEINTLACSLHPSEWRIWVQWVQRCTVLPWPSIVLLSVPKSPLLKWRWNVVQCTLPFPHKSSEYLL